MQANRFELSQLLWRITKYSNDNCKRHHFLRENVSMDGQFGRRGGGERRKIVTHLFRSNAHLGHNILSQ